MIRSFLEIFIFININSRLLKDTYLIWSRVMWDMYCNFSGNFLRLKINLVYPRSNIHIIEQYGAARPGITASLSRYNNYDWLVISCVSHFRSCVTFNLLLENHYTVGQYSLAIVPRGKRILTNNFLFYNNFEPINRIRLFYAVWFDRKWIKHTYH